MFSSFTPLSTAKFGFGRSSTSGPKIDLPPVRIHDTETSHDKPSRRLKHLLKLNHVNHAILFNHRRFHNHCPHILGSAYLLGGDAGHLNAVYDSEAASLVPWEDSPGEISKYDWREYLGKREYERAFVDFFEDELVLKGYDWKAVVSEFLFEEKKEPLVNCLVAGLGHPLIHLGYAFELNSREVAMEALGLVATGYNYLHKFTDDPKYGKVPTKYQTSNPMEVLARVQGDKRLDDLFEEPGGDNMDELFGRHEDVVMEHWNAWKITDPKGQFEQTQFTAVALLISAAHQQPKDVPEEKRKRDGKYDFFLVHLLTTSHALRILLPFIPAQHHIPVLRQWLLITIALYVAQHRPIIDTKHVTDYDRKGKDWDYVVARALDRNGHGLDAHFVKGVRAMKVVAETWTDSGTMGGDKKEDRAEFYLKAAVRFVEEFDGWGGFSVAEEEENRREDEERAAKLAAKA
jgi:Questin oxidase-like